MKYLVVIYDNEQHIYRNIYVEAFSNNGAISKAYDEIINKSFISKSRYPVTNVICLN